MRIAWDIETCPLPEADDTPAQQRRFQMELARETGRGTPEDEARRKVRSLHPMLGWICCLTVQRIGAGGRPCPPKSYTAATPAEEAALLRAFWSDVGRLGRRKALWVTFNGKRFDAEFLQTRTLAHGLAPCRTDLLDRYPYRHHPHADLACLWQRTHWRLDDVCDLLGVESPKAAFDASQVAGAVAAGDLESVRRYCEADVAATLACYDRLASALA